MNLLFLFLLFEPVPYTRHCKESGYIRRNYPVLGCSGPSKHGQRRHGNWLSKARFNGNIMIQIRTYKVLLPNASSNELR